MISARASAEVRLIGADRKRAAHSQGVEIDPGCVENADVFGLAVVPSWSARTVLGADRFDQTANDQNAHHPSRVVGQDVQRHFGSYVLDRFIWKCGARIHDLPSLTSACWLFLYPDIAEGLRKP